MKKYLIIAVVAMLIFGLVWYFVSKSKADKELSNPTEPTDKLKEAVIKKLGADYLAKKGKVRTYGEALNSLFASWQRDKASFNQYAIGSFEKDGKKDFAASIKQYIEQWSNESW